MNLILLWWGDLSNKKFHLSAWTRRAQMSAVATTVRSTDLLNCNVNSSVNNDYTRLQRHFLFKAPLSVSDISAICFWKSSEAAKQHPLDESHLAVVRGLIQQEVSPKCLNKESSNERRSYNRQVNRSPQL